MNDSIALSKAQALTFSNSVHGHLPKKFLFRLELGVITFVLLLLNWPLVQGTCNTAMIFLPAPVREGEWWRLLSHPFVHVTWYHLLLDGTAFFLLYKDLQDQQWMKRFVLVLASGFGSLLVSLWADPMVSVNGLCGLSGIAHGLMAASALDLISQRRDKTLFWIGICCFVLVIVKSLLEVLTGKMLFAFLYFGLVGSPIAVTHAGGVLGGLVAWLSFGFVVRCRACT